VSTEILMPFQLTASGGVAVTESPYTQAQQHVTALVSTNPGERVMLPGYGVALEALVFSPNDDVVAATIQSDVTQALAAWEPSITVNSVTPATSTDPTTGVAMVNVDFTAVASPSQPGTQLQTATILVGGTVINDS
jgi:phage baseplate assembly protein W